MLGTPLPADPTAGALVPALALGVLPDMPLAPPGLTPITEFMPESGADLNLVAHAPLPLTANTSIQPAIDSILANDIGTTSALCTARTRRKHL
jgi:hypothetical protein